MAKIESIFKNQYLHLKNKAFIKAKYFRAQNNLKDKRILLSLKKEWITPIETIFAKNKSITYFEDFNQIKDIDFDLIIPLTIEDSILSNEVPFQKCIPVPSNQAIHILNDKNLYAEFMVENHFTKYIPSSHPLKYPCIAKKKIDEWSKNCFILKNEDEYDLFINNHDQSEFVFQNLVLGKNEYATHILFKDNQIVDHLTIEYIFDSEQAIKGKNQTLEQNVISCKYLDIFQEILLKLDYEGFCCFNFKIENNTPIIFEINPRIGGSLLPYLDKFINQII